MGKTAFVFPGQGSQFVGMGRDLHERFKSARTLYQKASEILGGDLAQISFEGPEEKLKQTQYTQPALYVMSCILSDLLKEKGIHADAAAGHSLGEYSALAYAGAFSFEDGLVLVRERGLSMQKAGEKKPGSMAAIIGMEDAVLEALCKEVSAIGVIQPANFNSPGQIVVSGDRAAVERVVELSKERGARMATLLPVSGAFHSPLMADALGRFGEALSAAALQSTRIPVYANVTAQAVSESGEIRSLLQKQLLNPVRWMATVQNMIRDGVTRFVEVGAGKVLAGLIKRIDRNVEILSCGGVDALEAL